MTRENAIAKLTNWARTEVGYHEGDNNENKYADYIDSHCPTFYNGKKNREMWCDVFVDYGFIVNFGEENARNLTYQPKYSAGAGCPQSAGYYRRNGAFTKTPEAGCQIFFGTTGAETHTGIVIGCEGDTILTVEGNTSDMVAYRLYMKNDPSIVGYGVPNWKLVTGATESVNGDVLEPINPDTEKAGDDVGTLELLPTLYYGDGINHPLKGVAILQALLNLCGIPVDVDGEFGNDTRNAVYTFQVDNGIENDGICGFDTWKKLLEMVKL